MADYRLFETAQFQKDLRRIARAGQEGVVERRRDGGRRKSALIEQVSLQQGLRDLLDKQRVAICPSDDLAQNVVG